jgi:hypothetical protein
MPETRRQLLFWGLCAAAYLYVFPYQSSLNNPNENVRFYMTAALAESGTYAIDAERARWGWVNDAAVHGGHVYSVKAPGTSLLGVPGYYVYNALCRSLGRAFDRSEALWVCRLTGTILPTLAGIYLFMGFVRRRGYPPLLAFATTLSVWLGSLLYGYGMLFVSHTLSAVVAFAAFAFLFEVEQGQKRASLLSAAGHGALAAAVTWFEYPGLVCSAVLLVYALYALRSWWLRAAFALGGVLPALSVMHFQYRAFGNAFTPGHRYVETAAFRAAHEQGLYGAVAPSAEAMYGLLFDPGAGLFLLTPMCWFAVYGGVCLCRERATRAAGACLIGICALSVLAISAMNNWRGGWTIGPRYLAVCLPFLGFAALHGLSQLARRAPAWVEGIALGCSAAALVASGIPSAYYPHLPPELTRPLPQLFSVLIAHGFAPLNLGNLLGVWGGASMLPLLAIALALLASVLRSASASFAALSGIALLTAAVCLAPLWIRPTPTDEPGVQKAVAFVTTRYVPAGHDRAARLQAALRAAGPQADPRDVERLRELYLAEGRESEAARAAPPH